MVLAFLLPLSAQADLSMIILSETYHVSGYVERADWEDPWWGYIDGDYRSYDLTTSDPVYTKKLARRAASKNVAYLDAGMSGGKAGAVAGTLTLMVGGEKAAFKRTRSVLKPFTVQAKNWFVTLVYNKGIYHLINLMFYVYH